MAFKTKYPSWVREELKRNNVALATFYERVKRGHNIHDAVKKKADFDKVSKKNKIPKWVIQKGIENGLARGTIYRRLSYGYSYEEAIEPGIKKGFSKKEKYLYMLVTADEYELPLAVFDSIEEIANYLGIKPSSVRAAICLNNDGSRTNRKIKKVRYIKEDC